MHGIIIAAQEFGAVFSTGTTEAKAFTALWIFILVGVPLIMWAVEWRHAQLKTRRRVRQYRRMMRQLEGR